MRSGATTHRALWAQLSWTTSETSRMLNCFFFSFFFNPTGEIKLNMPTLNIEGDASELASDQEVVETLESLANGWLVLISSANEELQRKVPQVIGCKLAS